MMNAGRDSRGWEINRLPLEYKPPSSLLLIWNVVWKFYDLWSVDDSSSHPLFLESSAQTNQF